MGSSTIGNGGGGKRFRTIKGWMVSSFPRRSKTVGLRFLQLKPVGNTLIWTNMAEFRIANPAFRKYPMWTPEPMPATKSGGRLQLSL